MPGSFAFSFVVMSGWVDGRMDGWMVMSNATPRTCVCVCSGACATPSRQENAMNGLSDGCILLVVVR